MAQYLKNILFSKISNQKKSKDFSVRSFDYPVWLEFRDESVNNHSFVGEMKVKLSTSNRFEANFTWEKRRKTECPAFYSSSLPLSFILFYLKSKWRCLSKTGKKQQFNCRVHTYKAKDFLIDKYGGKFPCFSEIRVIESSSDQKIAIWFALLQ